MPRPPAGRYDRAGAGLGPPTSSMGGRATGRRRPREYPLRRQPEPLTPSFALDPALPHAIGSAGRCCLAATHPGGDLARSAGHTRRVAVKAGLRGDGTSHRIPPLALAGGAAGPCASLNARMPHRHAGSEIDGVARPGCRLSLPYGLAVQTKPSGSGSIRSTAGLAHASPSAAKPAAQQPLLLRHAGGAALARTGR